MVSVSRHFNVAVVGGGLGGLAAAALLARRGLKVVLIEQKRRLGGRAASDVRNGFIFNQGAHALYLGGPAAKLLRELGVRLDGGYPSSGAWALSKRRLEVIPAGFFSLFRTKMLTWRAKLDVANLLAKVSSIDSKQLHAVSWSDWISTVSSQPDGKGFLVALSRLTTYCNAPETLSAAAVLEQLKLVFNGGVRYLDGGWQTLVDGLCRLCEELGVEMIVGVAARSLHGKGCVEGLELSDGTSIAADAVLAVGSPALVKSIAGNRSSYARGLQGKLTPVRAACLDIALKRLPEPRCTFVLDVDAPRYFSVHSQCARLAPQGCALIHVLHYLSPGTRGEASEVREGLEALVDIAQPHWRDQLADLRFLPEMTVSCGYPDFRLGGLAGRPSVTLPDLDHFYIAGDWVGKKGMLLDATMHSVTQAVEKILSTERFVSKPVPCTMSV